MTETFVDLGRTSRPTGSPMCPIGGRGLMVSVDEHTDFHLFRRAGWHHPLRVGAVEVGGCHVLGIEWDQGDHSIRHRGERDAGQAYPVTFAADKAGEMVMR
ncbi:hypothetical protein ACIGBH_41100 [Streptomyces sp. NPDC085929]|uniref:hypothetical protein n=1 Tax=Streptomyces sp. NPDC085929 TaxID=3365739 RepID=UPI0037D376BB